MKSKRKYKIGDQIKTFPELINQTFVFFKFIDKPMHIEVIKSWQLRIVLNNLKKGYFYRAEKIEREVEKDGRNIGSNTGKERTKKQQ